jgi:hypothetical protein
LRPLIAYGIFENAANRFKDVFNCAIVSNDGECVFFDSEFLALFVTVCLCESISDSPRLHQY